MGNRKKRSPGPQYHAEGQHGERTHQRFIEMLQENARFREAAANETAKGPVEGNHRLHQDREQHDEAEKGSEKVEAMKDEQRGKNDRSVLAHARIPHEGDSD